MRKHFPNLTPEEVVKLSRVLVSVGSTALRRACGIKELRVQVDGVELEHDPPRKKTGRQSAKSRRR